MKFSLAIRSLLMFIVSIIFLVALTLGEAGMAGMSPGVERLITFVALVLAPGFGSVLGLMSLIRKERRTLLAIIGVALNTLFALFHLMIIFFAG